MDARIEKTRETLKVALKEVLLEHPEGRIQVEDILLKAHISRSTFYSHYKTVEDLISSIGRDIFHHVFSHSLKSEKTHDFSHTSIFDTNDLITHILYHLKEEKDLIKAISVSKYASLFFDEFRKEFLPIASTLSSIHPKDGIPLALAKASATENFLLALRYWEKEEFERPPEEISSIYFALLR